MGSRGKILFDLNEPPVDDDDVVNEDLSYLQPQKAIPSAPPPTPSLLSSTAGPSTLANNHAFVNEDSSSLQPQKAIPSAPPPTPSLQSITAGPSTLANNHAFYHASSVSGFQPFVRPKNIVTSTSSIEPRASGELNGSPTTTSQSNNGGAMKPELPAEINSADGLGAEKEEGEWSDAEDVPDAAVSTNVPEQTMNRNDKPIQGNGVDTLKASRSMDDEKSNILSAIDSGPQDLKSSNSNLEGTVKGDVATDGQEEQSSIRKQREVKGVEASHALRCANNLATKNKLDHQKEAMLGKKRSRQTMFLKLEEVKQAGPLKSSTPRRQNFPSPVVTRIVKQNQNASSGSEVNGEKLTQPPTKIQKLADRTCDESSTNMDSSDSITECDGSSNSGISTRHKRQNSSSDMLPEVQLSPSLRHGSSKHPSDAKELKNSQVSTKKTSIAQSSVDHKLGNKKLPPKKPTTNNFLYQDTSVERLIREVTNNNFWQHPEETEFQRVPGQFESVEEYIRVFEPLLFEECRAQLYNTWEELTETNSRDTHPMVRIKTIERRERGWYDVVVLPVNDCKWFFKEGDVAVLSTPRPGSVRSKRNNSVSQEIDEEMEVTGRVVGTVRRHIPIDTRDPLGAILHFYVGDSYDSSSKVDKDHILNKLQPKGIWYLTVLGSLATTQREYVALHAFRRLHMQMQTAILQPSPEHFPKYEEQPPGMPECFTANFVDHLHRTFNGPQLAAIQWAAMHTAAGTTGGTTKRQDPWPFTLVQGPPGTGKTHTVWGMLNVIHLVQYQHYYTALLKKLAPESYKQPNESGSESAASGSIDAVLQSMDQNLFRTLPKLCPKPRMLVCAPSNAATDELLSRVLDRGFIDGEMKVYRPDVARVGVDSQTRAAQAVSVERRTENLLLKSREEVYGWMQQLRNHEAQLSQQIACLQRELNVSAAAGRSQGSVGVDPEVLLARDQNRDLLLQSLASAVESRDKNLVEMSRLLMLEGRFRPGTGFNMEEARANLEASFANEAEIVFTTVSSSGRKLFSRLTHGFDMVVIDEAAQASEAAVLPPLSLGAARCVLVGDPQQLPATVISKAAGSLLYSRSLFERFQQAGCPTMLLSVQYRMHPQIRDFPSRHFYQSRLTDSESIASLPDEKYYQDKLLKPYIFYDIMHGRESHRGGSVSYQNIHEAQFCLRLYEHLQKTIKSLGLGKVTVGIITPYKLQLKCLQREFEDVLKTDDGKDIYINTVDAFQGQERDVIIMSCVRASSHGVGFVADIRRMNVALTRARRALWVMGNANALMQCDDWAALIADAKARGCYINMDSLPKEFLLPRSLAHTSLQGRLPSHSRGFRSGPRHRFSDHHMDSRLGTQSEDDKPVFKNGNQRPSKPPASN
ncbi:hypothetical protein QQ045_016419 [Rhodiola kirilowii]